jgi:hypothetical protein
MSPINRVINLFCIIYSMANQTNDEESLFDELDGITKLYKVDSIQYIALLKRVK